MEKFDCAKCGLSFERSFFYASNLSWCKQCLREAAKRSRLARIDTVRAYDRARGLTDKHREKVKRYANTDAGKAARLRGNREWRRRNREKMAAHNAVARALLKGTLTRGNCEKCGSTKSEAHHDDYARKLEVRWLCGSRECHKAADAERRQMETDR